MTDVHFRPQDMRIVLASGSPRRRELLEQAGYQFDVLPPDPSVEENAPKSDSPSQLVGGLAKVKARHVAQNVSSGMVLAADTVAALDSRILGKPKDREDARRMLGLLRGREHSVWTGICLWQQPENRFLEDVSVTHLNMQYISDDAIEAYLETGLWEGKAGAFGYQDGNDWLQILEGSESCVVGLPLKRLGELLADFENLAKSG